MDEGIHNIDFRKDIGMRLYKGYKGRDYILSDKTLAKGGEGEIIEVMNEPDCVAKIYHPEKRTEARHLKLRAMVMFPPAPETKEQVTWPLDILYDRGSFIGYIMMKLSGPIELNLMYTDRYRTTWKNYIRIAKNLCVAVHAVHAAGHICGDLNPLNIAVDPMSGRVTLVDTDSYHIFDRNNGRIYRCEVGQSDYVPKELQEKMKQGYTLQNAPLPTYSMKTDDFALAIHIFATLMNGCHPFACAILPGQVSVVQPQPKDNIYRGIFPFLNPEPGIVIPIYAPPITILPVKLQELFYRAFVLGCEEPRHRPTAVEWYHALEELEQELTVCGLNSGHRYYRGLSFCPWCELRCKIAAFRPNHVTAASLTQSPNSQAMGKPADQNKKLLYINRIRLFESDVKHIPDLKKRTYSTTFQKEKTRGIFFEISFSNHLKASLKTTLNYKLYNQYGVIVYKTSNTFMLNPSFDTYWWGWEFVDQGYLSEGKYKLEVWFEHSNTVSCEFEVINARQAAGLPPWNVTVSPSLIAPRKSSRKAAVTAVAYTAAAKPHGPSRNLKAGVGHRNSSKMKKKDLSGAFFQSLILAAVAEVVLLMLYHFTTSDLIPLRHLYTEICSQYHNPTGTILSFLIFYVLILTITLQIKITLFTLRKIKNLGTKIILICLFLLILFLYYSCASAILKRTF